MKRGGPLKRRTRLKVMSTKRAREVPERRRVVEAARARDGGRCRARDLVPEVACAGPLDGHEVIPRSAWRAGYLVLANVLTVCRFDHRWIDDHPKLAEQRGLSLPTWAGRSEVQEAEQLRLRWACGDPAHPSWWSGAERRAFPLPNE